MFGIGQTITPKATIETIAEFLKILFLKILKTLKINKVLSILTKKVNINFLNLSYI